MGVGREAWITFRSEKIRLRFGCFSASFLFVSDFFDTVPFLFWFLFWFRLRFSFRLVSVGIRFRVRFRSRSILVPLRSDPFRFWIRSVSIKYGFLFPLVFVSVFVSVHSDWRRKGVGPGMQAIPYISGNGVLIALFF